MKKLVIALFLINIFGHNLLYSGRDMRFKTDDDRKRFGHSLKVLCVESELRKLGHEISDLHHARIVRAAKKESSSKESLMKLFLDVNNI